MKHANARGPFDSWRSEVNDANWSTFHELKERHHRASILENDRVLFRIKGKKYRLRVVVKLKSGIVRIERVGTHAEYSKWPKEES